MSEKVFLSGTSETHEVLSGLLHASMIEHDPEKITALMSRIDVTLRLHFEVEEVELYPTLMEAVTEWDDRGVLLGAREDHRVIMQLLQDLEDTPPTDEVFRGKVHTLHRFWTHHSEEEEKALYDMADTHLGPTGFPALLDRIRQAERDQKTRLETERQDRKSSGADSPIEERIDRQETEESPSEDLGERVAH